MRTEAVAVAVVLLVVIGFGAGYFTGRNSSQTAPSQIPSAQSSVSTTTVSDSQTMTSGPGLAVYVRTNATTVQGNQGLEVNVSELSSFPAAVNLSAADAWSPLLGEQTLVAAHPVGLAVPCAGGWPIGVGLMSGHELMNNLSQGRYITPWAYSCTTVSANFLYFVFSPGNSTAIAGEANSEGSYPQSSVPTAVDIVQPVTLNPSQHSLAPGEYTIVAGDEWGNVALTYFAVTA